MVDDNAPPAPPQQAQPPAHQIVLGAINQLTHLWATCQECRVETKNLMVMVEPIPGRQGIVRPTGDIQMIFTFKAKPKVIA